MELNDLVLQLAEKIVDGTDKELFLETIKELGSEASIDDVLSLYENIGNANDELDSSSASKALNAFGLKGTEQSGVEPLHKGFNADPKTGQEASHNTGSKEPVKDAEKSDSTLDGYASKLNAGAKSKIKALKPNDKALPVKEEVLTFAEDINAIFEGTEFTAEFREKAQLIFETSVQSKINDHLTYLNEAVAEHLEELDSMASDIIAEELDIYKGQVQVYLDQYLDYIAEEFLTANEVALESNIKVSIAESIFDGFKGLLEDHNIDVSPEKIDLVDEVVAENEELVASYNEVLEENVGLISELKGLKKDAVIKGLSEGLSAVEAEKFAKLLDGIEYKDDASFTKKVNTLLEAYNPSAVVKTSVQSTGTTALTEEFYTDATGSEPVSKNSDVLGVMRGLDKISGK